ncbi:MAG: hypothetical protein ACTSQ8_16475 [Candidatus Helarchaeota archaeon]
MNKYLDWIAAHGTELVSAWKCLQCGHCCLTSICTFDAEGDDLR